MFKQLFSLIFLGLSCILIFSCNKEEFITSPNAKLKFTSDTLSFDTVFTTLGSTTKRVTVKNPNSRAVNISSVHLAGGEPSNFRLNINGFQSNKESNVQIAAGDSIFIFVEVTVNPTNENNPMVIKDSIVFNLNGNFQNVKLIAFGQDFHLFDGEVLKSQHWENDKPYLIYNSAIIGSNETLIIDAGCRIHFHKGSSLFVKGTMNVNGTFEEPVIFQGDRLEKEYGDVPGQWGAWKEFENGTLFLYGGIHFLVGSENNSINYAEIKNANKGIQVDSLGFSENPVLTLTNSRIENMTLNCIDARTTFIKASNCIFANSGSHSVALRFGGNYEFNHCTIANYFGESPRQEPALFLNNYYEYNGINSFDLNAVFGNCIVYGSNSLEIGFDAKGSSSFNYLFKNCLLKTSGDPEFEGTEFIGSIFNKDPIFVDISENNYTIDSLSPAINIGNVEIANLFPVDLNSNSRLADEGPDLGAIEWISSSEIN